MTWPEKGAERENAKELVVLLTNDSYIQHSSWSETSDSPRLEGVQKPVTAVLYCTIPWH